MLACAEPTIKLSEDPKVTNTAQGFTGKTFAFAGLSQKQILIFKNILACLSGAQMGSIHEKRNGRKSRDTAPLK